MQLVDGLLELFLLRFHCLQPRNNHLLVPLHSEDHPLDECLVVCQVGVSNSLHKLVLLQDLASIEEVVYATKEWNSTKASNSLKVVCHKFISSLSMPKLLLVH